MKLKLEELPDNSWLELIRKQILFYNVAGEVPFIYQVNIKFEDGSKMSLNYANVVEGADSYLVLTEHCGYYEVKKLGCKLRMKKMYT